MYTTSQMLISFMKIDKTVTREQVCGVCREYCNLNGMLKVEKSIQSSGRRSYQAKKRVQRLSCGSMPGVFREQQEGSVALARWLSWMKIILYTERLQVQFQVTIHTQVAGSIPVEACTRRQRINVFLTLMFIFLSPISMSSGEKEKKGKPVQLKVRTVIEPQREVRG